MSYKNCCDVSRIYTGIMKILILHGPNMNLLGLRSAKIGAQETLDRVNRALRKEVRNKEIDLKILQTHDEGKAVTFLHRNRNKAQGLIFSPGAWIQSGYVIKDTLDLIQIPYNTVCFEKQDSTLFPSELSVCEENPIEAYIQCLKQLLNKINSN